MTDELDEDKLTDIELYDLNEALCELADAMGIESAGAASGAMDEATHAVRYLEAPYERADAIMAAYEKFCEREGIDEDEPSSEQAFEAWIENRYEVE